MTERTTESTHGETIPTEKPRNYKGKKRGRKPASPSTGLRKPNGRPRRTKPGVGVKNLLAAANTAVCEQYDRIAQALAQKAVAGHIPSTRLLVGLASANMLLTKREASYVRDSALEKLFEAFNQQERANDREWRRRQGSSQDSEEREYVNPFTMARTGKF